MRLAMEHGKRLKGLLVRRARRAREIKGPCVFGAQLVGEELDDRPIHLEDPTETIDGGIGGDHNGCAAS